MQLVNAESREYVEMCPCNFVFVLLEGARGGAIGPGTALLAGMSRERFQVVSLDFSLM
jgi:hypothetical protein